jgi:hypothetical protein
MKQSFLKQIVLYRYRYIIGYGLFLVILAVLLTTELTQVPSGLSTAEMQSAVNSAQLQPTLEARVIDLPYHLLQKASLYVFGLSVFAIKLPSVIFGILSGIGLMLLLRRWFKHNVSVISALLAVSASMFLIAGRTGTPDIMVIFWAVYLLLFATLITQEAKGQYAWKIILGLVIGLSLYTPLSIYVLAAALIAALLHPHARYMVKRYGGPATVGALFLFAASVAPLAVSAWQDPQVLLKLAGLPAEVPNAGEYGSQLLGVVRYLADFTTPRIAEVIQPAFSIAVLILIALGILRSIIDNYSTRTYALLIWIALSIPVVALNPDFVVGLYLPAILFMAIGIEALIRQWYSLFPRNPYARIAGLLPLVALIGGVWYYNFTTYFIGYRYSPPTAEVFNNDLSLLRNKTTHVNQTDLCLVVPENQVDFYRLLEQQPVVKLGQKGAAFEVSSSENASCQGDIIAAQVAASDTSRMPTTFWVNDRTNNSLRWYVYFR